MITSQETTNLIKAMIEVAPEISSISKSKQAYGYKYATLDSLIDMLRSVLPAHGLWFMQMPTRHEGQSCLLTRIIHSSGEWMEDSIEMTDTELQGKANDTQKVGASITYYRRYALSSIFGVAADEDVDGNLNNIKQTQQQPDKKKSSKIDPADYIVSDARSRKAKGESQAQIYKDYADILHNDEIKSISDMSTEERTAVARALYIRNNSKEAK